MGATHVCEHGCEGQRATLGNGALGAVHFCFVVSDFQRPVAYQVGLPGSSRDLF